jgi:hypothetical protein
VVITESHNDRAFYSEIFAVTVPPRPGPVLPCL